MIEFKESLTLPEVLLKTIKERIQRFNGNQSLAAKSLGISRTTIRKYVGNRYNKVNNRGTNYNGLNIQNKNKLK